MQYDKLTFDARFLGIWYICPCTMMVNTFLLLTIFLVGENVKPFVISYKTTDSIDNVSDHLALCCTFSLYIDFSVSLNEDLLGHCV